MMTIHIKNLKNKAALTQVTHFRTQEAGSRSENYPIMSIRKSLVSRKCATNMLNRQNGPFFYMFQVPMISYGPNHTP